MKAIPDSRKKAMAAVAQIRARISLWIRKIVSKRDAVSRRRRK
jgi:hypothetical protein